MEAVPPPPPSPPQIVNRIITFMKRENRGFPHGVDSSRTSLSQKVMLLENSLTEANFSQSLTPLSFYVPLAILDLPLLTAFSSVASEGHRRGHCRGFQFRSKGGEREIKD